MNQDGFWTKDVMTVEGSQTMREAASLMLGEGVSSLLVVEDSRPRGIITEWDMVRMVGSGMDPDHALVSDVMTRDPMTLKLEEDPDVAKNIMLDRGFGHMPVVDSRGKLVGIVSLSDLVKPHAKDAMVRTIKVYVRGMSESAP